MTKRSKKRTILKKKSNKKEKYIVTSALPYVNGIKHLGNFIGSLLPADVYTRFLKAQGHDAIYICSSDDHGTPAELGAIEEKMPVADYVRKYHEIQSKIYDDFGLEFEIFGNTSDQANHEITQHLFKKLYDNELVEEKEIVQLYSVDEDRFLPDRFVRGTCPHCGYENARGDQCESCTQVLDPKELINPKSAITGSSNVIPKSTKHLFINLPKMQNRISAWVESKKGRWSRTSYTIAKKWLNDGLRSRSITRDLKWGIKVPLEGYENKVFYVWFDAPIGYIGATIQWANKIGKPDHWQDYWKDSNTKLVQFMGKDNVPFHTVTWPATMMGADDGFVLADIVKGLEWLNFEGGKFSTSQNRGVFLDQALAMFPADYWRYYLLLIAPERHDTDFTWIGFQGAANNDLANLLGNFVHRTLTFIHREFSGTIPPLVNLDDLDKNFLGKIETTVEELKRNFYDLEFQKALTSLRQFWSDCNAYFQEKQPWKLVKEDKEEAAKVLSLCSKIVWVNAVLAKPFIPETSGKIFSLLGIQDNEKLTSIFWSNVLKDGNPLEGISIPPNPKPLFTKIDDKQIDKLQVKFSGDTSAALKVTDVKGRQKKKKSKTPAADSEISEKKKSLPDGIISFGDFQKVELKVGRIIECETVKKSTKLLKISVDLGEDNLRQILAGLAEYYNSDDLVNKSVLVVSNLELKKMKGLESQGMILAANVKDKKQPFKVVFVEDSLPPGSHLS
ncbi:MAG: methionine--tRNA ligase [Candidatus Hodarchaeales archaeon]|jgi:methionyl-tRNA synthetase